MTYPESLVTVHPYQEPKPWLRFRKVSHVPKGFVDRLHNGQPSVDPDRSPPDLSPYQH